MTAPNDAVPAGSQGDRAPGAPSLSLSGTVTVGLFQTDVHGALAVGCLCDFLQEAAGNHAISLGVGVEALMARELTWVLSRMRLRANRLPHAGERLEVRTWPTGIEKLFALRDFRVLDESGATVAAAVSAWLIIGTSSRRPVRVQPLFDSPEASRAPRALPLDVEKLPAAGDPDRQAPVIVRLSDLDANGHANNARIVEWAIEGVGRDAWEAGEIREMDIDFLAEAMHGDSLTSRASARPDGEFLHSLLRERDGREIARARTRWQARTGRS